MQNDADLATVIQAWAGLPQAVKAGIVAMVNATQTDESAQNCKWMHDANSASLSVWRARRYV